MGRTWRRRRQRMGQIRNYYNLDHEEIIITLKQFMFERGWKNRFGLKLSNFPLTGRGVTSRKSSQPNDILITIPYKLMITYTTVQSLNLPQLLNPNTKLTIHDFLTLFLLYEYQKGSNSKWYSYIVTLPIQTPPLPWLLPMEQILLLPIDLQTSVLKSRKVFDESWQRVKKSIRNGGEGSLDCMLDMDRFAWAFSMVNTRAVYVNPAIVREMCDETIDKELSDEPSMGLCPYLDMFNHSYHAKTEAQLISREGQLVFELITLNSNKAYEQIFISYGSHNNITLLTEYGFFIPDNIYDVIDYDFKDILKVLNFHLDNLQYKFIVQHKFNEKLYISATGPSFNLKALLFVWLCNNYRIWSSTIFSDLYEANFKEEVISYCKTLLEYKLNEFIISKKLYDANTNVDNDILLLIKVFLDYRLQFLNRLLEV